ncbi:Gfo/Idh/MocA family protein [Sodalis ligni]|uniref:1,5-anhydro-D-fructose reductase (1,5-anhydro-D-mannitol-forming) n=1 Tax=Sodalis ligni TaxID=2697027 RepID=A0A4R1N4L2_9GAMM|nr:Gfo/Idh/MocA family oxidoreductase [Sodalis ligni]TCL02105.1 1,5-anhydro-D-fructose reductase (1,5-anhydro-D-mannitol-forming) [Sodalis ligni]
MKWALIGCSNIAREWVYDAINAIGDSVEYIVSSDLARASAFAAEHNIPNPTDDLLVALRDPDVTAVYISTKNHLHCSQALSAIAYNKHVMCEKPIALTADDAYKMLMAAQQQNVVLAVNHHLRNAASIKKIREIIKSGIIGQILTVSLRHAVYLPESLRGWRIHDKENGGGVILDITVHDADTLRFILDDDPVSVSAMAQSGTLSNGDIPESVMGIMRFKSGILVNFYDSFTAKYAQTGLDIIGTEGSIIAKDIMTQNPRGEIYLVNQDGCNPITIHHENLYENSFRQFKDAVQHGQAPAASSEDGQWSLTIGLAVNEAACSGKTVTVAIKE